MGILDWIVKEVFNVEMTFELHPIWEKSTFQRETLVYSKSMKQSKADILKKGNWEYSKKQVCHKIMQDFVSPIKW